MMTQEFMEQAEFIDLEEIDLDEKFPEKALKAKIRNAIYAAAGDAESLLGTTADATQLLLHAFASLVIKLHTANSLAEVREAAGPFAELSTNFLTKVESGDVKLPFQTKGSETVVSDIEQRATQVAEVLQSITAGNNLE